MQSYIFDFKESPKFFQKWNKEFDIDSMATDTFYLVIVDDICDDNIEDCLNSSNKLKYDLTHLLSEECSLSFSNVDYDIHKIILSNDITFELDDSGFNMKGMFITNSEGYVMGYSINTVSVNITTALIFEEGLEFWDIVSGER